VSILKYRGLLVVVLWQTVPNPVFVDSTGRVQLSFGVGAGQWESVRTDCSGNVGGTSARRFQGAGGEIDAWPTRSIRLTGFAGDVDSDTALWRGAYYGGLGALELQHFGIGGGVAALPGGARVPVDYLRIGNRDVVHFRFELTPPAPPVDGAGAVRLGLGYGLGHLRRPGGQAGIALCQARCDGNSSAAGYVEFALPLGSALDLQLRALAGPGRDYANTGIGVGARLHLGKSAPRR
jgi:hypothetical protein